MTESTIQDANELSNKSPINRMTVEVKKAFEAQEGEGQYGPWRIQACILRDDTGELRATFWNRFNTDLRNFEGESVTIVSGHDKKGKFSGIETDDYKGKRQLKISENATFSSPDGEEPLEDREMTASELTAKVDAQSAAPARRFVSEETKRESIERQVALKAAVEFYQGRDIADDAIVASAERYYQFLHGQPEVI